MKTLKEYMLTQVKKDIEHEILNDIVKRFYSIRVVEIDTTKEEKYNYPFKYKRYRVIYEPKRYTVELRTFFKDFSVEVID